MFGRGWGEGSEHARAVILAPARHSGLKGSGFYGSLCRIRCAQPYPSQKIMPSHRSFMNGYVDPASTILAAGIRTSKNLRLSIPPSQTLNSKALTNRKPPQTLNPNPYPKTLRTPVQKYLQEARYPAAQATGAPTQRTCSPKGFVVGTFPPYTNSP